MGPPSCLPLILVVSMTSVVPSHRPRDTPSHLRAAAVGFAPLIANRLPGLDSLDRLGGERRQPSIGRINHERRPAPAPDSGRTSVHPEPVVLLAPDSFLVLGRQLLDLGERDVGVGIV